MAFRAPKAGLRRAEVRAESPSRSDDQRVRAKPKKVGAQLAKRDAVLSEAAAQFNARGIGRTSLSDIAKAIGLTRAALYYYVDDRDELVFQCYQRAVEQAAADLSLSAQGARGLDRVIDFIRRSLSPERPPTAILGEIGFLADSAQAIVLKAHRRNASMFVQFIKSGIDDGSVRSCDAEVAGQAILGMLAWIPLSPGWSDDATATYQPRMTEALIDLVRNGVAADRGARLHCPLDVRDLAPAVGNVFDRDAVAASKVEQLLKSASQLFNRRGIEATSLDDITGQLGATKGAFYHYLRDKDELIRRCYARAFDLYDRIIDASEAAGQSGLEKSLFGLHLNVQAQVNGPSPLAPIIGALALPPRARAEFTKRARRTETRFTRFGIDGMADGSYRACDVEPMSIAGAGAFASIPKWLSETDKRSARTIADEITNLFLRGLSR